jgi:hypothetical protein
MKQLVASDNIEHITKGFEVNEWKGEGEKKTREEF